MSNTVIFIISLACGVLSGFGVGGGTLLVICMTLLMGIPQRDAQAVNLIFFIAMSPFALYGHIKNGVVEKRAVIYAVLAGVISAALVSFIAQGFDPTLLRRLFGVLLLFVGIREMFPKKRKSSGEGVSSV